MIAAVHLKRLTVLLLLWFAPGSALASSRFITDLDRIEEAERIVIGRLGSGNTIIVEEVLKGSATPSTITPARDLVSLLGSKVLWVEGSPLRELSHFTAIETGSFTWDLYHALLDPGPLCDPARHPPSEEILYVLAYLFDPVRIHSAKAPEVAARLNRPHAKEPLPWNYQGTLELKCGPNPARPRRLEVLILDPDNEVTRQFRLPLMDAGSVDREDPEIPSFFPLTIETRPNVSRGSMSHQDAVAYMRGCLKSPDARLQRGAIWGLARMRDLEAVPEVIGMIDHEEEEIAKLALRFLERSRDRRALDPLCRLLEANMTPHADRHALSEATARALEAIGDGSATPILEKAARHGVESASQALLKLGRPESFEVVLGTERGGQLPHSAQVTLYWLVYRSNKSPEPWMSPLNKQSADQMASPGKWRKWWEQNRSGFKLVRSSAEVRLSWLPPEFVPPSASKGWLRRNWPELLTAVVMLGLVAIPLLRRFRRTQKTV